MNKLTLILLRFEELELILLKLKLNYIANSMCFH